MGGSGSLAFGLFLASAADCILIDNSVRKLRSFEQYFVYLTHNRTLFANTIRLFSSALVSATVQFVAMINIVYTDVTWVVLGFAVLMNIALARRYLLQGKQMDPEDQQAVIRLKNPSK